MCPPLPEEEGSYPQTSTVPYRTVPEGIERNQTEVGAHQIDIAPHTAPYIILLVAGFVGPKHQEGLYQRIHMSHNISMFHLDLSPPTQ